MVSMWKPLTLLFCLADLADALRSWKWGLCISNCDTLLLTLDPPSTRSVTHNNFPPGTVPRSFYLFTWFKESPLLSIGFYIFAQWGCECLRCVKGCRARTAGLPTTSRPIHISHQTWRQRGFNTRGQLQVQNNAIKYGEIALTKLRTRSKSPQCTNNATVIL